MIINGAAVPDGKVVKHFELDAFYRLKGDEFITVVRQRTHIGCGINCSTCMHSNAELVLE